MTTVEPGLTHSELRDHVTGSLREELDGMFDAIPAIRSEDVAEVIAFATSAPAAGQPRPHRGHARPTAVACRNEYRGTGHRADWARLHGNDVGLRRGRARPRRRRSCDHPPRAGDGRHASGHGRHVRARSTTRSWSAGRSTGRRDGGRPGHQVRQRCRRGRGRVRAAAARTAARARSRGDRGALRRLRSTSSTSLPAASRGSRGAAGGDRGARWPSWSRRARSARSACGR